MLRAILGRPAGQVADLSEGDGEFDMHGKTEKERFDMGREEGLLLLRGWMKDDRKQFAVLDPDVPQSVMDTWGGKT